MSRLPSSLPLCGTLLALLGAASASPVHAQFYGGANPCNACAQPVATTCYQTVPVTEYQQVKQTVKRPVVETKYVEQPVTEYRPVTETRTAEVPQVTYHDVVECKTVMRDESYWQTKYQPVAKASPCQYDRRANFMGWLNRTAYSIRQSFTPNYVARREFVPRRYAQVVPVTRRVAQRSTRKVTYNVTKMVPVQTTRKVAVNTVRYVDEEVVATRPVTVMRTVPIGTATAYGYTPYGVAPTATALAPSPDPISGDAKRTANAEDDKFDDDETTEPRRFQRDDSASSSDFGPASHTTPHLRHSAPRVRAQSPEPVASRVPSAVRVGRWSAYRGSRPSPGPALVGPALTVAGAR